MKRTLLTGLLLLTLLAAALGWLLGSESGLRWAYRQAQATLAPGALQVEQVSGRLAGDITLRQVLFEDASLRLAVDRAELQWNPWALLSAQLDISRLSLGVVGIRLPPRADGAEPAATGLPQLQLPLRLSVDALEIERVELQQGEASVEMHELRLQAATRGEALHVDALSIEKTGLRQGEASIEMRQLRLQAALTAEEIRLDALTVDSAGLQREGTTAGLQQLYLRAAYRAEGIDIDELTIDRAELDRDETSIGLQQIQLQANIRGEKIRIDSLALRAPDLKLADNRLQGLDLQASGDIDSAKRYAHRLQVDWQTRLQAGSAIDNSALVEGDLDATRLTQETRGPLQARLVLDLDDPLAQLGWKADLRVDRFDTRLLDASLPVLHGALQLSASGDTTSARATGRAEGESGDYGKFDADFVVASLEPARLTEGVDVESLRLAIYDGELKARGRLLWAPSLAWDSAVSATGIDPAVVFPDWPGKLRARLQTSGQMENGELTVGASIEELTGTLRGYPLSLQSELQWRGNGLQVRSADLVSGNTRVKARGRVGDSFDLDWSLDSNDLAELYPGAQGKLAADGHLGGELTLPVVQARFNGSALRLRDYAIASVDGDVAVDLENWKQLDIRVSAAGLELQGQHLQTLRLDADGRRIEVRLDAAQGSARLELAGALEEHDWRGKLVAAHIDSAEYSSWRLQAPVAVRLAADSVSIEPFCLDSAQQARACGSVRRDAQDWNFGVRLTRLPLRLLRQWTPAGLALDGVVNADADLQYTADARLLGSLQAELPAASASYPLQQGKIERFDYRQVELSLSLLRQQARLTVSLTLQNEDRLEGWLTLPGADILRLDTSRQPLQAEFRVDARNWSMVDAMLPQIEDLRGALRLDIAVSGTLDQPRLQGSARLDGGSLTLQPPNYRFEQIELNAHSDGSDRLRYRIEAMLAAGRISLQGETLMDRAAGWPSKLSLQGEGFELATLLAPWIAPPLSIEGLMQASAELDFRAPDRLFGSARLSAPQGGIIYPLVAGEVERWNYNGAFVDLTLDESGIGAKSAVTIGAQNTLNAEAELPGARLLTLNPETQALQGSAAVDFRELDLLQYLLPEIDQIRGQLALDLGVGGSLAQPLLSANANMQQASFTIPRLGLQIRELNLRGDSDAQNRFNFELSALSGDGNLTIQGSSLLDAASGWPTIFQVSGENFEVSRIPEAQVTASPDLEISLQAPRIRIEGDLLLPYAKLQPKDIGSAARVSDDTVVIGRDQPQQDKWLVTTHVNLTLGERVTFFGFGFEGQLGGRLLVEDEPGELTRGTGEIIIREGRYRAYGQRLDIRNGRLLFTGSALENPGLDVRAVRQVNGVTVGLQVQGRLQQPQLELFSNPAMDQTNQLSYLLLGRPMDSASGSEGEMMAKAALALGLAGGDSIARKVGDRFGLDEMRVESSNEGDQASLVVGRYLSPKLYVSYGVGLIESINSLNLRYQLSERWKVEAESGEYQGADLLFTIER